LTIVPPSSPHAAASEVRIPKKRDGDARHLRRDALVLSRATGPSSTTMTAADAFLVPLPLLSCSWSLHLRPWPLLPMSSSSGLGRTYVRAPGVGGASLLPTAEQKGGGGTKNVDDHGDTLGVAGA
jgi:hypothetical protein